jgi:hypothetical protein
MATHFSFDTPRFLALLMPFLFLGHVSSLVFRSHVQPHPLGAAFPNQQGRRSVLTLLSAQSSASEASNSYYVTERISREKGQSAMDEYFLPKKEYGDRIGLGRDAQGFDESSGVIDPDDPRLSTTYGEFPLSSMDQLIDLGLGRFDRSEGRITMVDLGSGCGRLTFYSGLTRGDEEQPWEIHGIEIADILHNEGMVAASKGLEGGYLSEDLEGPTNSISLHHGPVDKYRHILGAADLVFAYATVFPAKTFNPDLGALILAAEWSQLLSESCKAGCIAITTDRALDPGHGWKLIDRLDVENSEVFGSTGYIHVLGSYQV